MAEGAGCHLYDGADLVLGEQVAKGGHGARHEALVTTRRRSSSVGGSLPAGSQVPPRFALLVPDAEMVVTLLESLAAIDTPDLRRGACDAVASAHSFDSARVIVAALSIVRARDRKSVP